MIAVELPGGVHAVLNDAGDAWEVSGPPGADLTPLQELLNEEYVWGSPAVERKLGYHPYGLMRVAEAVEDDLEGIVLEVVIPGELDEAESPDSVEGRIY